MHFHEDAVCSTMRPPEEDSTDEKADSDYNVSEAEPYKDEQLLYTLHIEKGLTQGEIAEHFDVVQETISYWMRKYGIQKPQKVFHRKVESDGKIILQSPNGDEPSVKVHQVTALEDFGANAVFHDDFVVHHLMNAPYAVDLVENLSVLPNGEHMRQHGVGEAEDDPEKILQHTFNEFHYRFTDEPMPETYSGDDSDDRALSWKLSDGAPNHCLNPKVEGFDD